MGLVMRSTDRVGISLTVERQTPKLLVLFLLWDLLTRKSKTTRAVFFK